MSQTNPEQSGSKDDQLLHLWECRWVLKGHDPDFKRCGYIAMGPGTCPYDHGSDVPLVPLTALVLCSDCGERMMRDDGRAPDGRLICDTCSMRYIADGSNRT